MPADPYHDELERIRARRDEPAKQVGCGCLSAIVVGLMAAAVMVAVLAIQGQ